MAELPAGFATYHTRVETWECDHNGHWNVRNYLRAFQQSADAVAATAGTPPRRDSGTTLHMRFHRELFEMAPVSVSAVVIDGGALDGAVVHYLTSMGRLSATALEIGAPTPPDLPRIAADKAALALPRGLEAAPHRRGDAVAGSVIVEHGFMEPSEIDHTGTLAIQGIMARAAIASLGYLSGIGFTSDYVRDTGISRMSVEVKLTRHARCAPGARLRGSTRLAGVSNKSFRLVYDMFEVGGGPVATLEQSLVTVDLNTRRAVAVPAFLNRSAGTEV